MLAYLHTRFSGFVPCRIVAVGDWSDNRSEARVCFTEARAGYAKGEFGTYKLGQLVPRTHVRKSRQRIGGKYVAAYSWPEIVKAG